MTDRRAFMKKLGVTAGALSLSPFLDQLMASGFEGALEAAAEKDDMELAADEDFWSWVRESFTVSLNIINLNNGGVSPQPRSVQEAHIRNYQLCNEGPSYYMWRILDAGREPLRKKLADLAGCDAEEIAINRNSTEGLNTVIFGLNLKAGDEVVLTKQDYPNMLNAWRQREKRDGIKLVFINLELPIENDEAIVKQFTGAFTDKTKVVHVTHLINWTGQILPCKRIADEAHKRGIEVIADGAHSFGHIDYKIPDLGCDYFATSLHKWLCAPFGSGLLYIKKDKIKNVWALLSNNEPDGTDIRKFESLGTRSFASEMAISHAIDFHLIIGAKRKEARLRYLKDYWAMKAAKIKGVKLHTSLKAPFSCAIANFSVANWKPEEIDHQLLEKYKIHTVGINWENIHGVRVTPHIYTNTADLDKLVAAITEIAGSLPKAKD